MRTGMKCATINARYNSRLPVAEMETRKTGNWLRPGKIERIQ